MKVVEHSLLVGAASGVVPRLAIFVATAQTGDAVHPAGATPCGEVRHPRWSLGDREATVAIENQRRNGGRFDIRAMHHEHRNRSPVERWIVQLRDFEVGYDRRIDGIAPRLQPVVHCEALHRNRCAERCHRDKRAPLVGIERRNARYAEIDHLAARPAFDAVDRHAAGRDQHLVAEWCEPGERCEHDIGALGNDRLPRGRVAEWCSHDATVRRVAHRDAHQRVAVELETGRRVDTFDHYGPCVAARVQQMDVDLRPSDHHVHEQVAPVAARGHIGPRLGGWQIVEDDAVIADVVADAMKANVAVVLIAFGVHRIPEAGVVWQPGHARGARVWDAQRMHRSGGDFHHVQHTVLAAALAQAVRHHAAVVRRMKPVDGDGAISGECGRVEQRASGNGQVDGAAHHERVLISVGGPFEHEQLLAMDCERQCRR